MIVEFKSVFTNHVNSSLNEENLIPEIIIDTVIAPEQLNESTVRTIREIGPFGEENPEPVLLMEKMQILEIIPLSQGKHLKLMIKSGNLIEHLALSLKPSE